MLCAGNAEQWCGGPNRFNLYAVNPWNNPSSTAALPESTTVVPEPTETEAAPETTTEVAPETTTEIAPETTSEAAPETTTSEAAESTGVVETTTEAAGSTDVAETTTSSVVESTEATPEPTSTAPTSTKTPEATSTAATSVDGPSTEGVPSTTFSPPTSTVAEETSTITTPAQLTTVTSCDSPTIVPGQTSCYGKIPDYCASLTNTDFDYDLSYLLCSIAMPYPMPTQVASCFPDSGINDFAGGVSVYSCVETGGLTCISSSECATATYTVGQEPATTPPAPASTPAPSNAVVANGGFETGDKSGWNFYDNFLPFNPDEISTLRAHNGSKYAMRAVNLNEAGHNSVLAQDVTVVPGGNYTLSIWLSHDNAAGTAGCGLGYNVMPTDGDGYVEGAVSFNWYPAGTWSQVSLDFQAIATWTTVTITYYCNNVGALKSVAGQDVLYLNDIEVLSRDIVQA